MSLLREAGTGIPDAPGICLGGGPTGCRMRPGGSPFGRTKNRWNSSDLDLGPEFDHATRRDQEVVGCTHRVADHEGVDLLLPDRHFRAQGWDGNLLADEGGMCRF